MRKSACQGTEETFRQLTAGRYRLKSSRSTVGGNNELSRRFRKYAGLAQKDGSGRFYRTLPKGQNGRVLRICIGVRHSLDFLGIGARIGRVLLLLRSCLLMDVVSYPNMEQSSLCIIKSPDNSPFSHSVFPVLSLPYWSF